jgi:DNA-binding CsgD family transcriptional regulator
VEDYELLTERVVALEQRLSALENGSGGRAVEIERLSPAERRVVELVVRGRTNAEVADRLRVAPKTVEWTLTRVYRKLGVRSRTELAATLAPLG